MSGVKALTRASQHKLRCYMRVFLMLAIIGGMGFAGAKLVESGDPRSAAQPAESALADRVTSVLSFVGLSEPSPPAGLVPAQSTLDSRANANRDAGPAVVESRYVANTGGDGVALRVGCAADPRLPGGLAEGSRVEVVEDGRGVCEGWSFVRAGDTETWVSERYLTIADRGG